MVSADVGDDREGVDDVAQRRGADREDGVHAARCVPRDRATRRGAWLVEAQGELTPEGGHATAQDGEPKTT